MALVCFSHTIGVRACQVHSMLLSRTAYALQATGWPVLQAYTTPHMRPALRALPC